MNYGARNQTRKFYDIITIINRLIMMLVAFCFVFTQLHLASYKSGLLQSIESGMRHQPTSMDTTPSHVREKEGVYKKTLEVQYSTVQ